MKNLKGKTVFITGASSGIGKATAEIFASLGANLIICARRKNRILRLASLLEEKYRVEVLCLFIDVREFGNVNQKISSLPKKWKKIDILVNNAGLSRGLNKIQDGILNDWEEMIDTNVKGLLYVSKCIIPLMLNNKKGHIINIGSIAGHEVYPAGNVYCASKFAVDAITKGMRIDLIDTPIKVSSVDPGMVNTEFSLVRFHGDNNKAKNVYKGIKPLKAEDIAQCIAFIATVNDNINIAQMIIFPKSQASSTIVHRNI